MGKSLSEMIKEILEGKTYWLKMESFVSNQRFYFYINSISIINKSGTDTPQFVKLSVGSGTKSFKLVLPYYQYLYLWRVVDNIDENVDKVQSKDYNGNAIHYCRSVSTIPYNGYYEEGDLKFGYTNAIKPKPSQNTHYILGKSFGVEYLDSVLPLAIHKANYKLANVEGLNRLINSYAYKERENITFRSISRIIKMFVKDKEEGKAVTSWALKASMRIQGKHDSYSLDAILNSELGIRKLDISERRRAFEVLGNIDSTNDQIGRAMLNLFKVLDIDLDNYCNGEFIAEAICGLADHDNKQWPYFREIALDENDEDLLHIFISGSSSRVKHSAVTGIQNILDSAPMDKTKCVTHVEGCDFGYASGTYGMRKIDACDIMHTRPILFNSKNVRKDKLVKSDVWNINI